MPVCLLAKHRLARVLLILALTKGQGQLDRHWHLDVQTWESWMRQVAYARLPHAHWVASKSETHGSRDSAGQSLGRR